MVLRHIAFQSVNPHRCWLLRPHIRRGERGIQTTASHNPPADNVYKVYPGTGNPIVSPTDREIESAIATTRQFSDEIAR